VYEFYKFQVINENDKIAEKEKEAHGPTSAQVGPATRPMAGISTGACYFVKESLLSFLFVLFK
jgi:hypothetical protein